MVMPEAPNLLRDSHGDAIHKLDYNVGNKEHGTLVQIDRANAVLPVAGQIVTIAPFVVPGIGAAAAYANGDQMGSAFQFIAPRQGIIREVKFLDLDNEGIDKELWLFRASPTLAADNAAFTVAVADISNVLGVFVFSTWRAGSNAQIGFTLNTPLSYDLGPGASIYGAVKTLGADNIAATALPRLSFIIERYG